MAPLSPTLPLENTFFGVITNRALFHKEFLVRMENYMATLYILVSLKKMKK